MEGCTAWESLWKITVPMVSPLMLVCWIYTIVDFFMKSDNQIMDKINTQMTELLNYGFSSAMALSMSAIFASALALYAFMLAALSVM